MKLPQPIKQADGTYRIRLRLNDQTLYAYGATERECRLNAEAIKASRRAARPDVGQDTRQTLSQAIESYCADRSNTLSPATLRKYDSIRTNQFQDLMHKRVDALSPRLWQQAVNRMKASYSDVTISRSLGLLGTVVRAAGGTMPKLSVGGRGAARAKKIDAKQFLEPEEILRFVEAAAQSPHCIPLLLALHSLRIAEIDGLDWSNLDPDEIRVRRVRIMRKGGEYVYKEGAKTESSVRDIPVFIPCLRAAILQNKQPEGKVLTCSQQTLRRACAAVCIAADIEPVTIHQLRHSFASLSAHLQIPMQISQQLGGWATDNIMKTVYVHVAQQDKESSLTKLRAFFEK